MTRRRGEGSRSARDEADGRARAACEQPAGRELLETRVGGGELDELGLSPLRRLAQRGERSEHCVVLGARERQAHDTADRVDGPVAQGVPLGCEGGVPLGCHKQLDL